MRTYKTSPFRVMAQIFIFGAALLPACTNPLPPATAEWQVEPGALRFRGTQDGAAPADQAFTLRNAGRSGAPFDLATQDSWIRFRPASGYLEAGKRTEVRVWVAPCLDAGTQVGRIEVLGAGEKRALRVELKCEPPSAPLRAQVTADPLRGPAPLTVTFHTSASGPDSGALTCTLDFGDGNHDSSCNGRVTHTYDEPGSYEVVFTVRDGRGGSDSDRVTVHATQDGAVEGFDVQLRFLNEPSDPAVRAAFDRAVDRWEGVITRGLLDVSIEVPADFCLESAPAYQGAVDDLLILVDVVPIDGVGGILGSAGPCLVRSNQSPADPLLPVYGAMRFDEADMAQMQQNGTLEAVILHEMGHVLGLGTLWSPGLFDFLNHDAASCQNSSEVTYDGARAMEAYHALGATGEVPVENTGGAGTRCGHWREATFDTELMTGFLDGAVAPLSRVTVGGLEDMGYAVDYDQADAFALPSGDATALGGGKPLEEVLIFPVPLPDP